MSSLQCYGRVIIDRECNLNAVSGSFDSALSVDIGGDVNMMATTIDFRNATIDFDGATLENFTGNIDGNISGNLDVQIVNAMQVNAIKHTGDLCGNVIGNLLGDTMGIHTGSVIGDVTGKLYGNVCGNLELGIGAVEIGVIGNLSLESGDAIIIGGNQVLTDQQPAVANASVASVVVVGGTTGGTIDNSLAIVGNTAAADEGGVINDNFADLQDSVNALVADVADIRSQFNLLLSALRVHGIIAM